jgi:hypothetical protein
MRIALLILTALTATVLPSCVGHVDRVEDRYDRREDRRENVNDRLQVGRRGAWY